MLLVLAWVLSFLGADWEQDADADEIPHKKSGVPSEESVLEISAGVRADEGKQHLVEHQKTAASQQKNLYENDLCFPVYDQENKHHIITGNDMSIIDMTEIEVFPTAKVIVEDDVIIYKDENDLFSANNYDLSRPVAQPMGTSPLSEVTEDEIIVSSDSMYESGNPLFDEGDLISTFLPSATQNLELDELDGNSQSHLFQHISTEKLNDLASEIQHDQNMEEKVSTKYSLQIKGHTVAANTDEEKMTKGGFLSEAQLHSGSITTSPDRVKTAEIKSDVGKLEKGSLHKMTGKTFKAPSAKLTEFEKIMKTRKSHTDTMDRAAVIFGKIGHRDEKIYPSRRKLSENWLRLKKAVQTKEYLVVKDIPLKPAAE